jgi:hypothetical protein
MAADGYADPAFEQWNNAFNACQNLYDDDELEECVNATEQDLDDPSMPLYHRMRYELLLAGSHEGLCEWWQAEDALTRCEAIFHSTSTNHKDDTDESIQKCLRDLRELIEGVRAHHAVQPHTLARPTYEDDVDMMDWYDGEADEQADKQADKDVKMEEIVEDENSVKRTPLSETGEIEDMKLVVEPEPAEPSLRLPTTPRLSADPPRHTEFKFEEHAKKSNLVEQSEPEPELNSNKQAEQATTPLSRWKRFRSSSAKVMTKISNAVKTESETEPEASDGPSREPAIAVRSRKRNT